MAYTKRTWVDRSVSTPSNATLTKSGGGAISSGDVVSLVASPGVVTQEGTPITASAMNNLESGVVDLAEGQMNYATSTTGNDTYVITTSYTHASYKTGMMVLMKPNAANTGASTINVNSLGAKAIKVFDGTGNVDTATGDILANGMYQLVYDGTDFILLNPNSLLHSVATATGDTFYASAANVISRLAKGTAYQSLKMNSGATLPAWGGLGLTGTFTDTSTFFSAGATISISVPLGCAASFVSFVATNNQGNGVVGFAGASDSNTYGIDAPISGNVSVRLGGSSSLCSSAFASDTTTISLHEATVSGTNLVLVFYNSGFGRTIDLKVRWGLW
jgi:hypothetical protein